MYYHDPEEQEPLTVDNGTADTVGVKEEEETQQTDKRDGKQANEERSGGETVGHRVDVSGASNNTNNEWPELALMTPVISPAAQAQKAKKKRKTKGLTLRQFD